MNQRVRPLLDPSGYMRLTPTDKAKVDAWIATEGMVLTDTVSIEKVGTLTIKATSLLRNDQGKRYLSGPETIANRTSIHISRWPL